MSWEYVFTEYYIFRARWACYIFVSFTLYIIILSKSNIIIINNVIYILHLSKENPTIKISLKCYLSNSLVDKSEVKRQLSHKWSFIRHKKSHHAIKHLNKIQTYLKLLLIFVIFTHEKVYPLQKNHRNYSYYPLSNYALFWC